MADEKDPALARSAPPGGPLSDFQVALALASIKRELELINSRLGAAETNDERFKRMEHDFRLVKWITVVCVGAALISVVNGVAGRMTVRFSEPAAPAPTSNADRMGSDRVPPTPAPRSP